MNTMIKSNLGSMKTAINFTAVSGIAKDANITMKVAINSPNTLPIGRSFIGFKNVNTPNIIRNTEVKMLAESCVLAAYATLGG